MSISADFHLHTNFSTDSKTPMEEMIASGMKKGLKRLEDANVKNISLSNLDALAEVAAEEGYLAKSDVARIIAFRNNPDD